jgi:hypothetical protein
MKEKWQQYTVYALSLLISLGLDLWFPSVKNVLCTPIGIGGLGNAPHDPTTGDYPTPTFDKPNL